MTNYDLLNQEKGLEEINVANAQKIVRRVSDLTIPEFKALWIECCEELERHKYDTAMKEYDRLTTKPIKTDEVFVKGGESVPQEY